MNETVTCQFAVIRFLPYPETQEFVNVGVVIGCPALGFMDFRLETHRRDRVTGFFPELDPAVFVEGRRMLKEELTRVRRVLSGEGQGSRQLLLAPEQQAFASLFREFVRPREGLFSFGGSGVSTVADPAVELASLFEFYVRRQFASHHEYQETVMTQRLRRLFRERDVSGFEPMDFGDELYRVTIPFVRMSGRGILGVKPLHLDKADTTKIIEYGDHWCSRIGRLHRMARHPDPLVLVLRTPADGRRAEAAHDARQAIEALGGVVLVDEADRERIVDLALSA